MKQTCKCGCGARFESPDKWGRKKEFLRGHNARMDPERRARQININRENAREKIEAVMQTDEYKEHMSESQKRMWEKRWKTEPDKAEEIMNKLYAGRAKIVYDEERRKRMSDAFKKFMSDNPKKYAEMRAKANISNIGKHSSPEQTAKIRTILQSQERRELVSKTHKGKPKPQSMKDKQSALWDDEEYRNTVKRKQAAGNGKAEPSVPELLLFDLFQMNDLPLEYVGYSNFVIDGFVPDFVNHEKKVIVECYGDYHHMKPDLIKRDVQRAIAYDKAGYKLLVFWEHDIHAVRGCEEQLDEAVIVDRIRAALFEN